MPSYGVPRRAAWVKCCYLPSASSAPSRLVSGEFFRPSSGRGRSGATASAHRPPPRRRSSNAARCPPAVPVRCCDRTGRTRAPRKGTDPAAVRVVTAGKVSRDRDGTGRGWRRSDHRVRPPSCRPADIKAQIFADHPVAEFANLIALDGIPSNHGDVTFGIEPHRTPVDIACADAQKAVVHHDQLGME